MWCRTVTSFSGLASLLMSSICGVGRDAACHRSIDGNISRQSSSLCRSKALTRGCRTVLITAFFVAAASGALTEAAAVLVVAADGVGHRSGSVAAERVLGRRLWCSRDAERSSLGRLVPGFVGRNAPATTAAPRWNLKRGRQLHGISGLRRPCQVFSAASSGRTGEWEESEWVGVGGTRVRFIMLHQAVRYSQYDMINSQ